MVIIALRYRRVSGLGQEDNSSLEMQLDRIDGHCETRGYESRDEYLFTEVMTGVDSWRERPEIQRLLTTAEQLVKKGYQVVVVVDHPDRFARGLDLVLLVELLSHYGAHVEFVQTKFEDTDEGKLVLHLESYSSKKEWMRIKKRTTDGRYDRVVKEHKLPGSGNPLYGYKYDDPSHKQKNRYVYNDDIFYTDASGTQWSERKVVEFIFAQAKAGTPIRRIAVMLNELGIPTRGRRGNTVWRHSFIGQILANPAYAGKLYSYQRNWTRHGNKYRHSKKPVEEQVLMPEDVCPPIIDEETFRIVQAQLDYNKRTATRNNKNPENALCRAGIAKCGACKGSMSVRTSHEGTYTFYCCVKGLLHYGCTPINTISTRLLDNTVWKRCCEIIRDPTKLHEAIEALRVPDPTTIQEIPVEIRKKSIEEEIENIIEMGAGAKSETARKKAQSLLKNAEMQLAEIEEEEKIIAGIRNNWQAAEDEILRFQRWCQDMQDSLEAATYTQKRTCVEYLGIRARVFRYGSPHRIKIDIAPPKILEALSGMGKNGQLRSSGLEYKA